MMGLTGEELMEYGRYAVAVLIALSVLLIARGQLKRSQAAFSAEQERLRQKKNHVEGCQKKPQNQTMKKSRTTSNVA